MSEKPKTPLTMLGAGDAVVCVDGVCEVPPTTPSPLSDSAPTSQS